MSETRQIPEFPGYSVTKDGRVWSYKNKKWLISSKVPNGYLTVGLCKNNKSFTKLVHRLVLEAYIGGCTKNMECRHLDGNKSNNNLPNLCWGTRHENELDKVRHGTARRGEKNQFAKLTEEDVRYIYSVYWDGAYNQSEIAKYFGITPDAINLIVHKKNWKHLWK